VVKTYSRRYASKKCREHAGAVLGAHVCKLSLLAVPQNYIHNIIFNLIIYLHTHIYIYIYKCTYGQSYVTYMHMHIYLVPPYPGKVGMWVQNR